MKKFLIASGVAVLAIATIANAATFNANLTVGSTGADVVALQTALIAAGFDIPAISSGAAAKGYFGTQTKAAVQKYQAAKAIPATGFVGPLTRAALNGGTTGGTTVVTCPVGFVCTPTTGGTTGGTVTLTGTDGTIADVDQLSQYTNEEVGDGQDAVKVLGMEVEASSEGDIMLKSIKVRITVSNTGGSNNLDDYIDSVAVWAGSTKVGSADAASFNESTSGTFTKTVTLSNVVVKAEEIAKIYVSVDGAGNLDSGNIDSENIDIYVDSIRFEDGSGFTTTDDSTGDLANSGVTTGIEFVSFAASADTTLKISTDSSNPDAKIVLVDDESDTSGVILLVGKTKLEGDSDVTISEFPVTLTGTASSSLAAIANSVTLKIAGKEYTESVSTTTNNVGTTTFNNLDITIKAGSTVTFTVLADINDVNPTALKATDMNEGYALKASVTGDNREAIVVENEEGDDLASGEKTGTANGNYSEFRTEGVYLTFVSATAASDNSDTADTGTFTIKFKVTAFGETVYVATQAASATTYAVYDSLGVATTSASIKASLSNTTDNTKTVVGNWEIEDGDTEQLTLTITVPNGPGDASDQYYAALTGLKWDLNDDASPANTYSSELDEYQTDPVFLSNN